MRRKGKLLLILTSILLTVMCSVVSDRFVGTLLNRRGYWTIMQPGNTEVYDTQEFTVTARMSSQGLRNPEVVSTKPSGTYRVLALGDSFTFGWGVREEETWVRIVEQKLNEKPGRRIEIVNAGAPGLGLDGIVWACQAYMDRFDVDAVILGMYGTDDLYQAASWKQNITWVDQAIGVLWPSFSRLRDRVIISPWYNPTDASNATIVFSKIWREYVNNFFVNRPATLAKLDPELRSLLVAGKVNPSLLRGASQDAEYIVKLLDTKNMEYALGAAEALFQALKKRCTGDKPVIVLYLSSNETVSTAFFPYRQKFGFAVDPGLTTFRPDLEVGKVVFRLGWQFITTLPEFRHGPCDSCFYPWDIHMTPVGNQKVADSVTSYIRDNNPFRW